MLHAIRRAADAAHEADLARYPKPAWCSGEDVYGVGDDAVRVSLTDIGEGLSGDYDEADEDDEALLRVDIVRAGAGGWDNPDETGSYCTLMPVGTSNAVLHQVLGQLHAAITPAVQAATTMDRVAQVASHMHPGWADPTTFAHHLGDRLRAMAARA